MKPLTIEHALKNNFTPIECVKFFKPDWSDEACYPFDFETMIKQLNNKFCIK